MGQGSIREVGQGSIREVGQGSIREVGQGSINTAHRGHMQIHESGEKMRRTKFDYVGRAHGINSGKGLAALFTAHSNSLDVPSRIPLISTQL